MAKSNIENEVIRIESSIGGYFPAYFAEIVDDNANKEDVIYDNVIDIQSEKLSYGSFATRQEAIDNVNLNYPIADKDCDYYGVPRRLEDVIDVNKYQVTLTTTQEEVVEVEATSEKEARKKALDGEHGEVLYQEDDGYTITSVKCLIGDRSI